MLGEGATIYPKGEPGPSAWGGLNCLGDMRLRLPSVDESPCPGTEPGTGELIVGAFIGIRRTPEGERGLGPVSDGGPGPNGEEKEGSPSIAGACMGREGADIEDDATKLADDILSRVPDPVDVTGCAGGK